MVEDVKGDIPIKNKACGYVNLRDSKLTIVPETACTILGNFVYSSSPKSSKVSILSISEFPLLEINAETSGLSRDPASKVKFCMTEGSQSPKEVLVHLNYATGDD